MEPRGAFIMSADVNGYGFTAAVGYMFLLSSLASAFKEDAVRANEEGKGMAAESGVSVVIGGALDCTDADRVVVSGVGFGCAGASCSDDSEIRPVDA